MSELMRRVVKWNARRRVRRLELGEKLQAWGVVNGHLR